MAQFTHLHAHSDFSLLDGAMKPAQMVARAVELGQTAIALTDHGSMSGAYELHRAATAAGITPIIGVEAYLAPGDRSFKEPVFWGTAEQREDDVAGRGAYTHATMWARNAEGLHNLFRLSSEAERTGQYRKPRMDIELLARYSGGIMATTGCPSGEVQTRLRLGQLDEALAAAARGRDIFGKENYFVEIMDHGLQIESRVRHELRLIAGQLGLRPVVTNDAHYSIPGHAEAHDALLCVQTGAQISDVDRFSFNGTGYHLRSAAEMYAQDNSLFWLEGCRNTMLIAERVETAGMFAPKDLMPSFPVPHGHTETSWFEAEVRAGMARRYPSGVPSDRLQRAFHEVSVIVKMGFPAYFLVVADFINWAKDNDIAVGPGRGSAAGSIVAYALGITDLDPVTHGLLFERFLNPERTEKPDIDVDFDERGRGRVIEYVAGKYGPDRVAQIITHGTIKAKAAVKDAARVLGHPFSVGDRITKAFPPAIFGKDIPLSAIHDREHERYAEAQDLRDLAADPEVAEVLRIGAGLEGLVRQPGQHAAGIIIAPEPLIEHVPLVYRDDAGMAITGFDFPTCDSLGLVKMDFLGLRNLTIISDTLANIAAAGSGVSTWDELKALPLTNRPTYDLIARGETLGIFQLDGGGMRDLLLMMRPDRFEDVSAALALYRPGPMGMESHTRYALRKNGLQQVDAIHPELAEPLAEILDPTHGLIIYQEQVQQIAAKVAGYSLGRADILRRAMGKKKKEVLDKEFVPFKAGMRERGYSDDAIDTLWEVLIPFAEYGFNLAHSAAYGLISYWTAYLKANHPAEYMAALLTSVGDDRDKLAIYLAECRRMGIRVLTPDVNASRLRFTPDGEGNIRFGLGAIRGIGEPTVEAIAAGRADGDYRSFADFIARVPGMLPARTVEALIKAGAFDSLGHTRRSLLAVHEHAVEAVPVGAHLRGTALRPGAGLDELESRAILAFEREMLGLYVSSHPLAGVGGLLAEAARHTIAKVIDESTEDGTIVDVAGLLTGVARKTSKRGNLWMSANLEDMTGTIEAMVFAQSLERLEFDPADDQVVAVRGKVSRKESGAASLMVLDMRLIDVPVTGGQVGPSGVLTLELDPGAVTTAAVRSLVELMGRYPGDGELRVALAGLEYQLAGGVALSEQFLSEARQMAMVRP